MSTARAMSDAVALDARPGPLEIATGVVFGVDPVTPLPAPTGCTPREALEREILPALLRPPCLVSFSGGRDSSAVLATAVALARREGLAPPIPATNVFEDAPGADEAEWQEHVIRHLGLEDWARLGHTDELDLIGPYAQRVLERHGLLWPFNIHFHLPLLDAARGGSLLTGVGGDELFAAARALRPAQLLAGNVRPEPRDLLRLAFAFAPASVRRAVLARRESIAFEWLRERAQRVAIAARAAEGAGEPRRLRNRLAWWKALRYLRVATAGLALTASDTDVLLVHPLSSPSLWSEVARAAPPHGFAGRTDGMRCLVGELLPDEICARGSKAHFDEAFWTARSREFARSWDQSGTDEQWVDAAALAGHWQAEFPRAQSFTLLQSAWLASRTAVRAGSTLRAGSTDRVEQRLNNVVR